MTYEYIFKELKKKIRKDYGKECLKFCLGCPTCQAHLALSIVEDWAIDEKADGVIKNDKNKR